MIAIDTNVLLRYLLWDDEAQSAKAHKLINGNRLVLIADIVLVECIWTLKGKKYKLDKAKIMLMVGTLFEEKNFRFENPQIIWQTLQDYRKAQSVKVNNKRKHADFSDALIVNKAQYYCDKNKQDFDGVYTFDIAAQELAGTKKP